MAYIIAPRRGKSSRMKKKALSNDGEESCLKISPIATQWSGLPFAAVKADSKRHEASQSNFQLQSFLDTFPNEIEESERSILRKIEEAWQRKDVDTMFQLIKENHFTDVAQKKVLYFWDVGHYYQESAKRNKPLTPLARFRIRERFLPPENICPNGRKKATLPKEATNVLRNWLDNSPRPYPTRETKAALAELTGLTTMQVNTWFANTRRRMRGRRRKEEQKTNSSRTTQPWQVSVFPTSMTSTPSAFPPCPGICTCPAPLPQFVAPTSLGFSWYNIPNTLKSVLLHFQTPRGSAARRIVNSLQGSNLPALWSEINANTKALMAEWPASHAATVGGQYFTPPVVALTPSLWEPELQYCGLHAAAQILMDMASK